MLMKLDTCDCNCGNIVQKNNCNCTTCDQNNVCKFVTSLETMRNTLVELIQNGTIPMEDCFELQINCNFYREKKATVKTQTDYRVPLRKNC